jgi:hypothetical protein
MEARQHYLNLEDQLEEFVAANDEHRRAFVGAVRECDGDNPEIVEFLIELGAGIARVRECIRNIRTRAARELDRLDAVGTLQMLQSIPMPDFSDEELLAATVRAREEWNDMVWRRGDPKDAIWSHAITKVLAGRAPTKGETSRVVHRLRKLEVAGKVERIPVPYGPALWRVKHG